MKTIDRLATIICERFGGGSLIMALVRRLREQKKIDDHILNLTSENSCRGSRHEQEIEN